MFEINVTVSSPDIIRAIELLVNAVRSDLYLTPAQVATGAAAPTAPAPVTPAAAPTAPVPTAPVAAAPAYTLAQVAKTAAAPTAPAPVTPAAAPTAPVPTAPVAAAPAYTLAQVAKAGAELMQSNPGLQPALVELIHRYGAQTMQEIPQDKLGAVATELRQMGAKI